MSSLDYEDSTVEDTALSQLALTKLTAVLYVSYVLDFVCGTSIISNYYDQAIVHTVCLSRRTKPAKPFQFSRLSKAKPAKPCPMGWFRIMIHVGFAWARACWSKNAGWYTPCFKVGRQGFYHLRMVVRTAFQVWRKTQLCLFVDSTITFFIFFFSTPQKAKPEAATLGQS